MDVEAVAETIRTMSYGDRHNLIDLALERQTDEFCEQQHRPADEAA